MKKQEIGGSNPPTPTTKDDKIKTFIGYRSQYNNALGAYSTVVVRRIRIAETRVRFSLSPPIIKLMSRSLTWIEVSQNAINYNLRQFRKLIGKDKLLMPVLKSNAYGHGFLEMARICDQNKNVDRICVVNLDEALVLIKNRIRKPILILSFYDFNKDKLKLAIKNKVIFPIYEMEQAKVLSKITSQINKSLLKI